MARTAHYLAWLSEIDKTDTSLVGTKGVLLGELARENFPIPKGFIITSNAYYDFLRENNLSVKINHLLTSANFALPKSVEQVSKHIRDIISKGILSKDLINEIQSSYRRLSSVLEDGTINIKPVITSEHSKNLQSFANLDPLSNIKGDAILIDKIKLAWSHAYTPYQLIKRHEAGQDNVKEGVALIIEKSIDVRTKGEIITYDIKNEDKSKITIADTYIVKKSDLGITETDKKKKVKISDKNIRKLAEIAIKLEKLLYFPQSITFGIEKDNIYILDTKPLAFYLEADSEFKGQSLSSSLMAEPAAAGIASGPLKFILSIKEINNAVSGDVVVLSDSSLDYLPAIKKASAVVTLNGGKNSYAAQSARQLGIPAVANAGNLIKNLKAGSIVTVNGVKGEVYKGGFKNEQFFSNSDKSLKTATKLYLSLSNPDSLEIVAKLDVDGVNPLNADFMIKKIGVHPKKMIRDGKEEIFIDKLSGNIEKFCKEFNEKIVVYRFSDLKSSEYRSLTGGKDFEPEEANPTLGFRGAFRYLHDQESFKMELAAVKRVREKGFTNLHVSIPFVRTPQELDNVKKTINNQGLQRSASFKIWMVLETPANVLMLEKFLELGVDGVSIDLNILAMLTIGTDKENFEVSSEFSNLDSAIIWSLEHIINICAKYSVSTSLYGLGVSENSELVKKLIDFGINSLSVLSDSVDHTKRLIYQTEKNLLLK